MTYINNQNFDLGTLSETMMLAKGGDTVGFIEVDFEGNDAAFGAGVLTLYRRLRKDAPLRAMLTQADTTNAPLTITAPSLYGPYNVFGLGEFGVAVSVKSVASVRLNITIRSEGA